VKRLSFNDKGELLINFHSIAHLVNEMIRKKYHCFSPAAYALGFSSSILTEMRVALLASRAVRLNLTMNLPADYTQLTLDEVFYLATMGGAEGAYTYSRILQEKCLSSTQI